jgi:hypothetical protein
VVDLTFSKERIRAEFEHYILNKLHPKVQRPPTPDRGDGIPKDPNEIDQMCRAYNLVEEHLAKGLNEHESVLHATLRLYTNKRKPRLEYPPSNDKRYQQVKRWHRRLKAKSATCKPTPSPL